LLVTIYGIIEKILNPFTLKLVIMFILHIYFIGISCTSSDTKIPTDTQTPGDKDTQQIADTAQELDSAENADTISEWIWPVDPHPETGLRINDTFGPRVLTSDDRYDFHRGIDLSREIGTPVYAVARGTVTIAGEHSAYRDTTVQILHETPQGELLISHYTHLSEVAEDLYEGLEVEQGDIVAYTGQGSSSYPHLHFELRRTETGSSYQRNAIHPLSYLDYPDSESPIISLDQVEINQSTLRITSTITVTAKETDFLVFSARAYNDEDEIIGEQILDLNQWNSSHTDTALLDEQELEGVFIDPMEFNVNGYPLWSATIAFTDFQITDSVYRVQVSAKDTSSNESTSEMILNSASQ
jgi:hypothetical protein